MPPSPTAEGTAPDTRTRSGRGGIPLFGLWIVAVLLLALASVGVAVHLASRAPEVVERTTPAAAPAAPSAETVRRVESLRAVSRSLQDQIDALRREGDPPPCPPGTARPAPAGTSSPAPASPAPAPSGPPAATAG